MAKKHTQDEFEQSTTKQVFTALDTTTHKTEAFFEKYAKQIGIIFALLVVISIGYFSYLKLYQEPRQVSAVGDLYKVQESINNENYEAALKGQSGNFLGLEEIIKKYEGTDGANIAKFSAASASYNKGDYKKALDFLNDFSSKDEILGAMKIGMQGDCNVQLKKYDQALEMYQTAATTTENAFTSPLYLKKLGVLALTLNKKEVALKAFTQIKEKYETTSYGQEIDKYIARSK